MSALKKLLDRTVDYAGLFPPAALDLATVVNNYSNYLGSRQSSMLGRIIIPASRLAEFAETEPKENSQHLPWNISALAPPITENDGQLEVDAYRQAINEILEFNEDHGDLGIVDALEVRTNDAESLQATLELVPGTISAFIEIPLSRLELIQEIKKSPTQSFAKIRTGGVKPELIPSTESVAGFIQTCVDQEVGFKATAGLHHPIRAEFNLTYEADSPKSTMHGFLNVFVASVIGFAVNPGVKKLAEILSSTDATHFRFSNQLIGWGDLEVSQSRIEEIRKSGIISFGSCSFTEPTTEICALSGVDPELVFGQ